MTDHDDLNAQLAAYLVDDLDDGERAAFETELRTNPELESELLDLGDTADLLVASEPLPDVPVGLADRIHEAVAAEAGDMELSANGAAPAAVSAESAPAPERRSWLADRAAARRPRWGWQRFAAVGALAVSILLAGIVASQLTGKDGNLEVTGDLTAANGNAVGSVEVREIGIGRIVDLSSEELPILPKGEYYEVWFVGKGDSPGNPNRISAGTFHPDTDGNSDVQLKAAVDPALFPLIQITAEPGDGDPIPSGNVVAELDSKS